MSRIGKFVRLSPPRKRQTLEALLELVRVRLGVTLFRRPTKQMLAPPDVSTGPQRDAVEDLAWAVGAASRYVPRATCLVQALALQAMCARRGHVTALKIGVAHGKRRELEAHAWLESEGRILIGSQGSSGFSPLAGLPAEVDTP